MSFSHNWRRMTLPAKAILAASFSVAAGTFFLGLWCLLDMLEYLL